MRRGALALLIVAALLAAAWAIRRDGVGARAEQPATVEETPSAPRAFPTEPAAFVSWLSQASPEAQRDAAASMRLGGSDSLLAAVADALGGETPWAGDFLEAVGPRAVGALEARCLRWDQEAVAAFLLALHLADLDERQRFLAVCLEHPADGLRCEAAAWIRESTAEGRFVAGGALLAVLARALATTQPVPQPGSTSRELYGALVASLVRDDESLPALLAADSPDVRAGALQAVLAWVEAYAPPTSGEGGDEELDDGTNPRAKTAASLCARLLSDPDQRLRCGALHTLGLMGMSETVPVPADLIAAKLGDVNEVAEVRAAAAQALGWSVTDADTLLRPYLHDPSPVVRAAVLEAFRGASDDASLDPELRSLLDDPDGMVRAAAASALGGRGQDAVSRARLQAGLNDPNEAVRLASLNALCRGGPPVEAIPQLGKWLKEGSALERETAVQALSSLKEKAAPLELAIISTIPNVDVQQQCDLIKALAELPGQDERAFEALLACCNDEGMWVRKAALDALVRRFPDRALVADALRHALSDRSPYVVAAAAGHLVERGQDLAAVANACARILEETDMPSVGARAIEVIGRCGRASRTAVPALLHALDRHLFAEKDLAGALGALPELADVTVPELVRKGAAGNRIALAALDRLGSAAEPYLSATLQALDPELRAAFEHARERLRSPTQAR